MNITWPFTTKKNMYRQIKVAADGATEITRKHWEDIYGKTVAEMIEKSVSRDELITLLRQNYDNLNKDYADVEALHKRFWRTILQSNISISSRGDDGYLTVTYKPLLRNYDDNAYMYQVGGGNDIVEKLLKEWPVCGWKHETGTAISRRYFQRIDYGELCAEIDSTTDALQDRLNQVLSVVRANKVAGGNNVQS